MSKTPASVVPPVFPNDLQETTYLYIPNNAVGAIIGTKGSHIRSIMRFSNASLKIAPLDADKPLDQQTERKVTIVGTPEGQWKAQYMIFEKMREEGFMCGTDDVRLTVELLVASSQVNYAYMYSKLWQHFFPSFSTALSLNDCFLFTTTTTTTTT